MNSLSSALRWGIGVLILQAVIFLFAGAFPYYLNLATIIAIYGILALGLGVLAGMTGQLSMGHGALFGVGAYLTAYMVTAAALPFWVALAIAIFATAACGAIMGIIALRFEGIFFAIVTFAFSALVVSVLSNWRSVTGGANGLSASFDPPPLTVGGTEIAFDTQSGLYLLVALSLGVAVAIVAALAKSRFGRACVSIREDEVLARCLGVNAFRYKLAAFILSSALAGFAGGWYATYLKYIAPELFTVNISIEMLMVLIIGGMLNPVMGPLVGTAVFILLPEMLRFTEGYRAMVFGLLAIVIVLMMPEGMAGGLNVFWRYLTGSGRKSPTVAVDLERHSI